MEYMHHFILCGKSETERKDMHIVDWHAAWLNVKLGDKRPVIYLDERDFVSPAAVHVETLTHPRVGIVPFSDQSRQWPVERWRQLCDILEEAIGASVIQLGRAEDEFLGFGCDLRDKTTLRQSAAVMGRCDLVVCADNGYSHLAAAVDSPRVILFDENDPKVKVHPGRSRALKAEMNDGIEGIEIRDVVDAIVDLVGLHQDK
jgi:ADP-heptose:LPS heptosyltransferase